jgi:hypothetical protein
MSLLNGTSRSPRQSDPDAYATHARRDGACTLD